MHRLHFGTLLPTFGRSWACRAPSVRPADGLPPHCGLKALVSAALGFGTATWHRNAESEGVGRTLLHRLAPVLRLHFSTNLENLGAGMATLRLRVPFLATKTSLYSCRHFC